MQRFFTRSYIPIGRKVPAIDGGQGAPAAYFAHSRRSLLHARHTPCAAILAPPRLRFRPRLQASDDFRVDGDKPRSLPISALDFSPVPLIARDRQKESIAATSCCRALNEVIATCELWLHITRPELRQASVACYT